MPVGPPERLAYLQAGHRTPLTSRFPRTPIVSRSLEFGFFDEPLTVRIV